MAQELSLLGAEKVIVPAHIAKAFEGQASNVVVQSISVDRITFPGKVWTVTIGGEKNRLMGKDSEGEEMPLASLPVVILDFAKVRGRAYFEGDYDRDNTSQPDCYSLDGVVPELQSENRQANKCADCPMSVKGSKVSPGGTATTACSQHRILALVPAKAMHMPPLMMRIPMTSDYDGRSKDLAAKGLFAFSNYLNALKQRGVEYTNSIVTKMIFDPSVEYPKILFTAVGWVDEANIELIKAKDPGVDTILGETRRGPLTRDPQALLPGLKGDAPTTAAPPKGPPATAPKGPTAAEKKAAKAAAEKAEREAAEKAAAERAAAEAAAAEDPDEKALRELQERIAAKKKADTSTAATTGLDLGGDVETGGEVVSPEQAAVKAAPNSTQQVTEAVAAGTVPDDVAKMLAGWGADD